MGASKCKPKGSATISHRGKIKGIDGFHNAACGDYDEGDEL